MTRTAVHDSTGAKVRFAAFTWSLFAVAIGLWHLLVPGDGPFSEETYQPLIVPPESLPAFLVPAALMAAGAAGLLLARARRRPWPVTALYAVVFGLCVPSSSLMSATGYLTAFAMPVVLVAGPVLLARRPVSRIAVAAAEVALLAALHFTGLFDLVELARAVGEIAVGFAGYAPHFLAQAWAAAGGVIWGVLTFRSLRGRWAEREAPAWFSAESAVRWGRVAAWMAFACSLPYGLTRMTWLTPWPFPAAPEGLDFSPEIRAWGLFLGFAALGGGVLCLGLTQRWGERWPYWVPVLRGRPVPPKVAIVPASVVAVLFTIAGVTFPVLAVRTGFWEVAAAFPFYIWGPALGAATLAYALRRGVVTRP